MSNREQPDDNISPLVDEIEWDSKPTPNQAAIARKFRQDWMEKYREDAETTARVVDNMLAVFKEFQEEDDACKPIATQVDQQEAARILANALLYDPPIYEDEVTACAKRFNITEREAEHYLRRRRAYDF